MTVGEHPVPSAKGGKNSAASSEEQNHPRTGHDAADTISEDLDLCGGRWLCISSATCGVLGLLLCWNAYLLARAHTLLASSFCYLFSPSSNESELIQKANKEIRAVVRPQVIRQRDEYRQKYLDIKEQHSELLEKHSKLEAKYTKLLKQHSELQEQQQPSGPLNQNKNCGSPSRKSAKKNGRGRRNKGSDMQRRLNNLEKANKLLHELNDNYLELNEKTIELSNFYLHKSTDNLLEFYEHGKGYGEQLKDLATALRMFVDTTKKAKRWAEEKQAENQKLTAQLAEEKAENDKVQNELNELKFRDLEMVD